MTRGLARALGAGRPDIILTEHFQERRARQPADEGGLDHRQRQGRQENVIHAIGKTVTRPVDREPAQIEREDDQEQCPEIEIRHGIAEQRESAHAVVGQFVAIGRGKHTKRHAGTKTHDRGNNRQLDRIGRITPDEIEYRGAVHVGGAEIEGHNPVEEIDVLVPEGTSRPILARN